jgi:AcrR family transcriptional regulator
MAAALPFYLREIDPPAKRAVLRAAMKLFSERGLDGTSIRDIAKESGYTNPALYKHFASKQELALHLFETCHRRVWSSCSAALASAADFDGKLDAYVGRWLELVDEHPEVLAFLADSARTLWPQAGATVRRQTMIGLAHALVVAAPTSRRRGAAVDPHVAAASIQGTLSELARMIQVGVVKGPATRWKADLVALFRRLAG